MLSKPSINKLKQILKSDYGQDISTEQAEELGTSLLRLTRVGLSALARKHEKDKKEKAN